jgi:hypothetical protein
MPSSNPVLHRYDPDYNISIVKIYNDTNAFGNKYVWMNVGIFSSKMKTIYVAYNNDGAVGSCKLKSRSR